MTGGYVDLEQARWDVQVATGQTVAGSGVEARMREARAAAGRLAAGLPGLLDELEQLRRPQRRSLPVELADAQAEIERLTKSRDRFVDHVRKIRAELPGVPLTGLATAVAELRDRAEVEQRLSAELADARAAVERVSAAWADVIQRQQRADNAHRYDVEEITGRAVAAERALEAVRALCSGVKATPSVETFAAAVLAALSAASPTTSNEPGPPEPKLCGYTGAPHVAHLVPIVRSPEFEWCPGDPSGPAPTTSDDEWADQQQQIHERRGRLIDAALSVPAASDEPARCPHGKTEAHWYPTERYGGWCPGPAASGTPETTR